ncbi:transmembrane protein [Thraustotheca clavata]|uniref:Mitochondrial import inner membrane translocase subunit Tim21 n=1 Tax=Thraustotheca clavata TaxID=74557 RepID=A0A1V9ZYW4_9STRA|nr:transmembrane protein [Thraustotheca clavata]
MLPIASLRRALGATSKSRSFMMSAKPSRKSTHLPRRMFCDKAKPNPAQGGAQAEAQTDAIVLTPYEKVAAGTQMGMWAGILGLATVCGYFIVRELFPSRMSPNSLFSEASDIVLQNDMVLQRLGAPIRCYGRDHGGHKEGRRNFIEHVELNDKDGQKTRLRIKFNMKGPNGKAQCWAETNANMKKGEYVYLIVQTYTGEIIKIHDNRQILQAESEEERDALKRLLGN